MIEIDGALGEGGGQIFRSSLTLSMCLNKPVKIVNIRARRSKPGLLRQHLTCLKAAQEISGAKVEGDFLGASTVTFEPGMVSPGHYRFSVGSAGSTTLVFQTVFLPLALASKPSVIELRGGTHNGMAPSVDFIEQSFLPLVSQVGWNAKMTLEAYGFYPRGGGAWSVSILPIETKARLDMVSTEKATEIRAVASSANLPAHITQRELSYLKQHSGAPALGVEQRLVESPGPGNILSLHYRTPQLTSVFEVVGDKGVSAERVASSVVRAYQDYRASGAVICEHLADQLVLPLLMAQGGRYKTGRPSQHLLSNIHVVNQFTEAPIELGQSGKHAWIVDVAAEVGMR